MSRTWKTIGDEETVSRAVAIAGTIALLVLAARLLLGPPRPFAPRDAGEERIRLVFSTGTSPPSRPLPVAPPPRPAVTPQPADPDRPPAAVASRPAPQAATQRPAATTEKPVAVYGPDGRVQLPAALSDRWNPSPAAAPGTVDADAAADAARRLHPPNPVEVRPNRFAEAWISDGDAADVVQQEIMRAQRKIATFLFGKDIRHAIARPSPEVRFNPARHERGADLGSEATGDAYKAAPISYQPAPGLDGEASRRIREQVAALEEAYARCDRARLEKLMQPLLLHLDELQKVEAAKAAGADPVRAEHMLPNAANGAYDMARRALWYADDRMAAACGG